MRRRPIARKWGLLTPFDYGVRNRLQVPSLELVFRQVVAQGALADAHQVRRLLLDAAGAVERAPDRFLFDPLDVRAELQRGQVFDCPAATPRTEMASIEMAPLVDSTTARSIVFSSSRTLPGHS